MDERQQRRVATNEARIRDTGGRLIAAIEPVDGEDDVEGAVRGLFRAMADYDEAWARRVGVHAAERRVLLHLADITADSPTELSRLTGMTTAGMTSLLDRLERVGLVVRARHATDGRRVLVSLTKRGVRACYEHGSIHGSIASALLSGQSSVGHARALLDGAQQVVLDSVEQA